MSESVPLNQRAARRESAVVGEPVEVRAVSIDAAVQRQFEAYFRSPLRGGRFQNPWPHQIRRSALDVLRWRLQRPPASRRRGAAPVPVHDAALADFARLDTPGRLLWLGHATFHVEIDGVPFMIDPIFGPVAGIIRRVSPLPVALPRLPSPRVVLLTHGHADHMDRRSLELLCEQADREIAFIVPLRLSRWLPKACRQVIELSWWESVRIDGVEFMLVPAQHWHRRGLTDEDECLWGGYVARGSCSLYHSGDTAYFGGFGAIGSVAPGLDVACLPLGAYEPRWFMQGQHMAPEQSLAAFRELGARSFVGMHWGTYDLSDEAIDAGPEILQRLSQNDDASPAESVYVIRPGGVLGFGAGQVPRAYGRLGGDESAPRRRGTPNAAVKSAAAHDSGPPSSPSNA